MNDGAGNFFAHDSFIELVEAENGAEAFMMKIAADAEPGVGILRLYVRITAPDIHDCTGDYDCHVQAYFAHEVTVNVREPGVCG